MIVVVATPDDVENVRDRLVDLGGEAVQTLSPTGIRRLLLAEVADEPDAHRIAAALRSEGRIAVVRPDGGARLQEWTRHTNPIVFGEHLSVCFAWSEHDRTEMTGAVELGLGGFGNGEHPTTRLLIEQTSRRISGGERVLDVGCGSGVLGLCALQLGASCVVAVDNHVDAVEAARRNAVLNAMDDRMQATLAPLDELDGDFDVIVANIGRAALVELAPQLVRLLAPGGWLGASGFSPPQCSLVAGYLRPLVELERHTAGEWSALFVGSPTAECS